MNYSEKLEDPRWQTIRIRIFKRDNYTCCFCGFGPVTEKQLNCHHIYYLPSTEPWDYPDKTLLTVCRDCHPGEHLVLEIACEKLFKVLKGKGMTSDDIDSFASNLNQWITDKDELTEDTVKSLLDDEK